MPRLLKQYALALVVLLSAGCSTSVAEDEIQAAIDWHISRLVGLEASRGLEPEEYFELGTLYWAKRDFASRSYIKNDLSRKASRSFSQYAQTDELAARKAIALFCIERIRQSIHLGIRASDDFLACSTMVSRYISREGDLRRDDSMDLIIRQAMANEVLYDISYRFSHWEFLHLKRLGDALLVSTLVVVDEDLLAEAFITNLESRLGQNQLHPSRELGATDYEEIFRLAQYVHRQDLSEGNREDLEAVVLNAYAESDKLTGLSRQLIVEAMRLLKQAKASIIVYHLNHHELPTSLAETGYDQSELPDYASNLSLHGNRLSLTFADHLVVPGPMEGSKLVRTIEIERGIVVDTCSPSSSIPQRYLPDTLSCS